MRELMDADLFHRNHPSWPSVSPGEWPLTDAQIAEDEREPGEVPPVPAHLAADPFSGIPGADGDPDPM